MSFRLCSTVPYWYVAARAVNRRIFDASNFDALNPTIDKCFLKVGQDIFNDDLGPFNKYMETLSEITLYKTLIEAQTRADLSVQDDAAGSRRRTHA